MLAHRFGFGAVDPDAAFLAKLGADEIEKLRAALEAKGLIGGGGRVTSRIPARRRLEVLKPRSSS